MGRGIEMLRNTSVLAVAVLLLVILVCLHTPLPGPPPRPPGLRLWNRRWTPPRTRYTWTLTNGSDEPGLPYAIIWSLQPFNVPAPISHSEPAGWEWNAGGWQYYEVAQPSKKYYTPPSIAPGQSVVVHLRIRSDCRPRSTRATTIRTLSVSCRTWRRSNREADRSTARRSGLRSPTRSYWHDLVDRCTVDDDPPHPPIPEPCGLITLAFGLTSLASLAVRGAAVRGPILMLIRRSMSRNDASVGINTWKRRKTMYKTIMHISAALTLLATGSTSGVRRPATSSFPATPI